MILDCLENSHHYEHVHTRLPLAFEFLRSEAAAGLPNGRHELQGSEVFAIVQQYETKPREQGFWEAHRRYIDVQYVVEGIERMGYANLNALSVRDAYDAEKDYLILDGDGDWFTVAAGHFAIFAPQDAHMPSLAVHAPATVRKIVVKVAV
jgi:YhcH/YjgK/YiaL family protein